MAAFLARSPAKKPLEEGLIQLSAYRLKKAMHQEPSMSDEHVLDNVTERMLDQIELLKKKYA